MEPLTLSPDAEATYPPIHHQLARVMADVGAVSKDSRNASQGFNFRGIDAVVNAVGPVFRKHGVTAFPLVEDATYDTIPTKNGGTMRQCTLKVRWRFVGPAGDHLDAVVMAEAMDSGDKATSKAHSVSYRTALLQVLCIPTDEPDPDASTYERAAPPAPVPVISSADADRIRGLLNDGGTDARKAWLSKFAVPPAELPATRLAEANDWLSDLEVKA